MKHAGAEALNQLEAVLKAVREFDSDGKKAKNVFTGSRTPSSIFMKIRRPVRGFEGRSGLESVCGSIHVRSANYCFTRFARSFSNRPSEKTGELYQKSCAASLSYVNSPHSSLASADLVLLPTPESRRRYSPSCDHHSRRCRERLRQPLSGDR